MSNYQLRLSWFSFNFYIFNSFELFDHFSVFCTEITF